MDAEVVAVVLLRSLGDLATFEIAQPELGKISERTVPAEDPGLSVAGTFQESVLQVGDGTVTALSGRSNVA